MQYLHEQQTIFHKVAQTIVFVLSDLSDTDIMQHSAL